MAPQGQKFQRPIPLGRSYPPTPTSRSQPEELQSGSRLNEAPQAEASQDVPPPPPTTAPQTKAPQTKVYHPRDYLPIENKNRLNMKFKAIKQPEIPIKPTEVYFICLSTNSAWLNKSRRDLIVGLSKHHHIRGTHCDLEAGDYLKTCKPVAVLITDEKVCYSLLRAVKEYASGGGTVIYCVLFALHMEKYFDRTFKAFGVEWKRDGELTTTYQFNNASILPQNCLENQIPAKYDMKAVLLANVAESDIIFSPNPTAVSRSSPDGRDVVLGLGAICCTNIGDGYLVYVGQKGRTDETDHIILALCGCELLNPSPADATSKQPSESDTDTLDSGDEESLEEEASDPDSDDEDLVEDEGMKSSDNQDDASSVTEAGDPADDDYMSIAEGDDELSDVEDNADSDDDVLVRDGNISLDNNSPKFLVTFRNDNEILSWQNHSANVSSSSPFREWEQQLGESTHYGSREVETEEPRGLTFNDDQKTEVLGGHLNDDRIAGQLGGDGWDSLDGRSGFTNERDIPSEGSEAEMEEEVNDDPMDEDDGTAEENSQEM